MEILIGACAAVVIPAAFFIGFSTGRKTAVKPQEPVTIDEEFRHWNELQQKALLDCLSYSQEIAYGNN